MAPNDIPLCVDLDGTLVKTDTLWESLLLLVKEHPKQLLHLPQWLLKGKAYTKQKIAEIIQPDPKTLPYCDELLEHLRAEHAKGRTLILATGANHLIAKHIAAHVGLFSDVIASDDTQNMSGHTKQQELVRRYGHKGFEYAGNGAVDIPVWQAAHRGIVVRAPRTVERAAAQATTIHTVVPTQEKVTASFISAMRPYQWIKNVLIFVPLIMAHQINHGTLLFQAVIAFISFSVGASALYIINDLLDLPSDRHHHTKRYRTLAAGNLPLDKAIVGVIVLLIISFALALTLPISFLGVLILYMLGSSLYSFYFKRIMLLDVFVLSSLYTVRLIAGSHATHIVLSFWLLAFSIFFFLSLALIKRSAELVNAQAQGKTDIKGRGYVPQDLQLLISLGTASGYLSTLVLALYINSNEITRLYTYPFLLWLLCPIMLYWISRLWIKTYRGGLHEDPIIFAFRDKVSLSLGIISAILLYLAV